MDKRRAVVLGGGGGVGRVAAETLAQTKDATDVVVADISSRAAEEAVTQIGDDRFRAAQVDVTDPIALTELIAGAAVVVNCAGPFYRLGPSTLATAISAGVEYVDICDDLSATRAMLELNDAAAAAGVKALLGMGNSPGLANVFVRMCADWFLGELTGARITHIHGGESDEGAGVIKHRIHAMTSPVPFFVDGKFISVGMLDEAASEFVRHEEFPDVGNYPVYPYPHPETITLPRVFPTLRNASNLGVVFPLSYFHLTQDLARAGMADEEALSIGQAEIAPIDMMVALLRKRRPALMAAAGITGPAGCLKVEVTGLKDGKEHTYIASLFSDEEGAGAGTGVPAGIGAILSLRGLLEGGPGVHPPEAIVPVPGMLAVASEVVPGMGLGGRGGGLPMRLEHVAPDGLRRQIPFALGGA